MSKRLAVRRPGRHAGMTRGQDRRVGHGRGRACVGTVLRRAASSSACSTSATGWRVERRHRGRPHRALTATHRRRTRRARCRAPRPDELPCPPNASRARTAGSSSPRPSRAAPAPRCPLRCPLPGRDPTRTRRACRRARRCPAIPRRRLSVSFVDRRRRVHLACMRTVATRPSALDAKRRFVRHASRTASARRRASTSDATAAPPFAGAIQMSNSPFVLGAERDRLAVRRPRGIALGSQVRRRRDDALRVLAVRRHRPDRVEPARGEALAVGRPGGFAHAGRTGAGCRRRLLARAVEGHGRAGGEGQK